MTRRDRGPGCRRPRTERALAVGVINGRKALCGRRCHLDQLAAHLEMFDFAPPLDAGPDMGFPREHLAGAVAGGAFYVLAGRAAGCGTSPTPSRTCPVRRALGEAARHEEAARRHRRGHRRQEGGRGRAARSSPAPTPRSKGTTLLPADVSASPTRAPTPRTRRRATRPRVDAIEGGPRAGLPLLQGVESLDVKYSAASLSPSAQPWSSSCDSWGCGPPYIDT